MITMIKLLNVGSRGTAEIKVEKLKVATQFNYHNLEYLICPAGGSFDIMVQADYDFEYESGRPMTEADAQHELHEIMIRVLMHLI